MDAGKGESAHNAELMAAKILAAFGYDIITDKELFCRIKEEFRKSKAAMGAYI